MNSPYKNKFKVTQEFKGTSHDGLDLVGVENKNIYSTINGKVEFAGWENILKKKQGFGRYVRIKKSDSTDRYYFGHLSSINVKKGKKVKKGDLIGVEGSTGNSTGSHCHYCIRDNASKSLIRDVSDISGIPNKIGTYTQEEEPKPDIYYKQYNGNSVSIVTALESLGYNSSYAYRAKIAKANAIKAYLGTAKQNTNMLNLLKKGKLKKV